MFTLSWSFLANKRRTISILVCVLGFATLAHSQQFEGANASSERVLIDYRSGQYAELAWYRIGAGSTPLRERWIASPVVNGFRLTANNESKLLKPGTYVEYTRVNRNSSLFQCSAGCTVTMPRLIASNANPK